MRLDSLLERDVAWSQQVAGWGSGRGRPIVWLLARSGDSVVWLAISAVLIWLREPIGWQLLVTVAVAALLTAVAKGIFKRQRPEEKWAISTDKYSFPSGHASRAAAVATTLAFAYPAYALLFALWALLVAFARVALSRHFLSDVVSGLLFGGLVSLLLQLAGLPSWFTTLPF